MSFDPNGPCQKFCGGELPKGAPRGTVYQQDGIYYNGKCERINVRKRAKPAAGKLPEFDVAPAAVTADGMVPTSTPPNPSEVWNEAPDMGQAVDYNGLHWAKLRQMMKQHGQEWTDRDTAIEYLHSLPPTTETPA